MYMVTFVPKEDKKNSCFNSIEPLLIGLAVPLTTYPFYIFGLLTSIPLSIQRNTAYTITNSVLNKLKTTSVLTVIGKSFFVADL